MGTHANMLVSCMQGCKPCLFPQGRSRHGMHLYISIGSSRKFWGCIYDGCEITRGGVLELLSVLTLKLFLKRASNHEIYTWGRSQEDTGVAYCISIKQTVYSWPRDESTQQPILLFNAWCALSEKSERGRGTTWKCIEKEPCVWHGFFFLLLQLLTVSSSLTSLHQLETQRLCTYRFAIISAVNTLWKRWNSWALCSYKKIFLRQHLSSQLMKLAIKMQPIGYTSLHVHNWKLTASWQHIPP